MILFADSKGPDQTARMRSLIWAFADRICAKKRFRMARPIYSGEVLKKNTDLYLFFTHEKLQTLLWLLLKITYSTVEKQTAQSDICLPKIHFTGPA